MRPIEAHHSIIVTIKTAAATTYYYDAAVENDRSDICGENLHRL